jgi:hypothetical protein
MKTVVISMATIFFVGLSLLTWEHLYVISTWKQANIESQSPKLENAPSPTATIDYATLVSKSKTPTLTGTAKNTEYVVILLYPLDDTTDYGVYGVSQGVAQVTEGKWSFQVGGKDDLKNGGLDWLSSGQYRIDVREFKDNSLVHANGLSFLLTGTDLASATLIISKQ